MREIYKTFKCFFYCCVCFCLFALFSLEVHAQAGQCLTLGCSTGVSFGSTQSTTSTTFVNSVSGTWAGEYNTYNVTSGMQYEWSLCTADGAVVGTNTDSQLSLRRNDTNAALCYSDDLCGAHAKILWTATFTGVVRVYIHRYNCTSLSTSHTVRWRCVSCGGGGGGCVGPPYCDQTQPGPGYTLLPACQTSICAADSYCCSTQWDSICATAASTNANCVNCRSTCSGGGGCTYTVPFSGSNSITTCTGTICEHAGTANYSNNANGFTIINPATAGNMVRLTFTSFSLECCCDFVTVFNGAGTGGTTLFNGNCTSLPPVLTSTVGPLTIRFTSDFSVVSSGFSANISCVPPPCTLTANAGSNVSICNGSSTVLTGSSSGISPTYSWSPSGSLNNPNISNPTASPSTTTTYTLTVTEGACTATSQVTVTVNPSPSAPTSVTASPSNHCPGGGVTQLNATSSGNSIRWFTVPVGGSSLGTSGSGVNFPVSTSSSTTYYAEALTGAGCISSTRTAVTVTVGDAIPPTINCPSTVTVGNMAGQCAATVNFITPTGTDNCPGATTIQIGGLPSGSSFPVGSTTNTFLVQAGNGQTAQCSFNVVVNDTQAPSANCQNATVSLGPGGIASVSASQINNGSVDNCGITGTSLSGTTNYNCTHIGGTFTVTLQVNDAAGNTATCSATVTVNDNNGYCCDAPQAICHPSPSVILNGSGTATLTPSQVDNGSTADCGLQSMQVSPTNFNCAHVGFPQTVVLTVTDIYNNTSTCQTTLTVADNSPPSVVCKNHQVYLSGNSASITTTDVYGSGSDNCGTVNLQSVSPNSFDCNDVGSNTVVLTVMDVNGNTATCSSTVMVIDNTPPSVSCKNINVNLVGASVTVTPADVYDFGSDDCGTVILESVSPNTFTCSETGTNTVVLTVNDGNGNTASCSATVTVSDSTPPIFGSCPENILVNADENCIAIATWILPNASDNCSSNMIQIEGSESGQYFPFGSSTITYLATDDSNNTAICSFTVTIQDVSPPTVACQPGEVSVNLSGSTATINPVEVIWYGFDNCGYLYYDSVSPATLSCEDVGSSHTVTLTVHDGNGNSSTCNASVVVYDNEAPAASCQDISVDLNESGNVSISAGDINDDSTDNCGISGMSIDVSDFDCEDVGENTVTLTVTDVNGKSSECTATVTVNDDTDPDAQCQNFTVNLDVNNSASVSGEDLDDGSSDACGLASLSASPNSFGCGDVGENTVTLTVYDNNGNSSSCTSTVTVVDTEEPVAGCQDVTVTLDENGTGSLSAEQVNNGSSDNCDFDLLLDQTDFTCANQGSNTVTLTVTDGSGNTSTCSAIVTVIPGFSASIEPSGSTSLCENECIYLDAGLFASYLWSANAGSSTGQTVEVCEAGTYSVTVTDINGCTSTAEISVTVNANPTPEITADGPVIFCEGGSVGLDAGLYSAYLWNELGGNATTQSITATEGGIYSVTVTDANGCTGEASIELTELSLPVVSVSGTTYGCVGDEISFTASGGLDYVWSGPNDFTSNSATVTFSNAQADISGVYTVTVTDANGCSSEYEVTVTISTIEGAMITGNTIVCLDDVLTLTASGGTSYEWSGPNGFTSSGANLVRPDADGTMAGEYTVSVSDGGGCVVVLSTTVTVSGAGFSVSISGSTNACVNGTIYLTASASGAVSYEWHGPDGLISPGASLTRTGVTTLMSGIYTVYATNAGGCIASATREVIVNSTTAIVTGTTDVCIGGTINLIASGGNSYVWSGPGGYSSNAHSILRTGANTTMSGVYSVTVSNSTGCTGTANILVTVHSNPSATLSGTSTICSGGTITITAPAGAAAYSWTGPNGFTATGGPSLIRTNANSTMAGQYKVTVTNTGGCTASAARSVSVSAPTTAAVTPTTSTTSFCSNANVIFTATTVGTAYSWTGPGGFTASTAAISAPPVAGQYKVTVTLNTGCIATATRNASIIAAPNAVITGNLNVCVGGTISLLASGGNSYNWSGPGGYTRIGNSVLRTGATTAMSGTYTVTVTGSGGCKATASVVVTVTACKNGEDAIAFETLFAYPNPTNNQTTITFTALKAEQMYLSVFAVDGREVAVLFDGMTGEETPYEFVFDATELPSGTYYAMLRRADGTTQQIKLMVVR